MAVGANQHIVARYHVRPAREVPADAGRRDRVRHVPFAPREANPPVNRPKRQQSLVSSERRSLLHEEIIKGRCCISPA